MTSTMIVFEENGLPVELITDRELKRAVDLGRIRPETSVQVYSDNNSFVTRNAGDVERLKPLFGIDDEPEPDAAETAAQPPDADEAAAPRAAPPWSAPYDCDDGAEDGDEEENEEEERYAPAAAPAPPAPAETSTNPLVPIGIIVGLLAVAGTIGITGSDGGGASGTGFDRSDINMPEDAGPVDQVVGSPQTLYARREVAVRSLPAGSSTQVGTLSRGESLYGVSIRRGDAAPWFRVESGTYSGSYVWPRNLTDEQPPELSTALDENRAIAVDTSIHAAPDAASAVLQTVKPGLEVALAGELTSGWWEVALRNGGVGYLPPDAFTAPIEAAPRYVRLQNNCPVTIQVRLLYQAAWGPEDAGGNFWTMAPGQQFTLTHQDQRVEAMTDEIYYHLTTPDGPNMPAEPTYLDHGASRLPMARANYSIDTDGAYRIPFC